MAGTCGARTRSGAPCKRAPMDGKRRCKLHGGASTGPKKGSRNAAKPGSLYSAYLTPEESKIAAALTLGSVDEEIRLTRIRLMRALKLEQERADTAELDSEVERDGAENVTAHHERHLKVRDYAGLIDRLTARIAMLEKTRAELMKDAAPADSPVTKIEIEVVSARKNGPVSDDGAAG
ncbi:HGGxSTG domain-containing protein [Paraburkholderia tropica]|uniref:HGGxSTG domain-containing protein n=1 Tax=Paraburkholderia tropica TaxID=92647 RepID=UPI003D2E1F62